ncbi:MAG: hypothetical protein BWY78_00316 [Alphaproteobacteria bacterium ADurb.Bin438]|nr:MAG: hypothetical protein BWY78_00316 [Alphaproteobacteria bacterium ADurb.Bin438]
MIGLFMIFVLGVVLALHIVVTILFSKLGKDNKKKRLMFGSLGFLLVFSIFFGDHIFRRIQFNLLCGNAGEFVYNKKIDKLFNNSYKDKKVEELSLNGFYKVVGSYGYKINPSYHSFDYVFFDKNNELLYYSYNVGEYERGSKVINLKDGTTVSEQKDFSNVLCGWFFRKINIVTSGCSFGSCKYKKLGKF